MNLIQIEQVNYGHNYEVVPEKGETYINPDYILYVEKRYKSLGEEKGVYIYIVSMKGGCDFHVSEECFNRIVGREMDIPEGPEIYSATDRPKKPEINPGHPIKQMF